MRQDARLIPPIAVGATLLGVGLGVQSVEPVILAVAVLASVLILGLILRRARGSVDLFEPLVLFVVAWSVMFVIRPTVMVLLDSYDWFGAGAALDLRPTLSKTVFLAVLGAVGFQGGYLMMLRVPRGPNPAGTGANFRLDPLTRNPRECLRLRLAAMSLLGGACLSAFLFLASATAGSGRPALAVLLAGRSSDLTEAQESTTTYFWYATYLAVPALLCFVWLYRRSRDRAALALAGAAGVFVAAWSVPTGSRMMLLPTLLGLIVLIYLDTGRRPGALTVAIGCIAALGASALVLQTRDVSDAGYGRFSSSAVRLAPRDVLDPLLVGYDAGMAPSLAAALSVVDREPPTLGASVLVDALARPIPRVYWASKPEPTRTAVISTIWPSSPAALAEDTAFSVLLYPYMDFRYAGVLVLLFGYGSIAARAYTQLRSARSTVLGHPLAYALVLPVLLISLRDSPTDSLVRASFLILPLLALVWFAQRRLKADGS